MCCKSTEIAIFDISKYNIDITIEQGDIHGILNS